MGRKDNFSKGFIFPVRAQRPAPPSCLKNSCVLPLTVEDIVHTVEDIFTFSPRVEAFLQNCSVEDNSSQRLRIVTEY